MRPRRRSPTLPGCFIRYTDRDLAALGIARVEGRMSIRDAVAKALRGLAL